MRGLGWVENAKATSAHAHPDLSPQGSGDGAARSRLPSAKLDTSIAARSASPGRSRASTSACRTIKQPAGPAARSHWRGHWGEDTRPRPLPAAVPHAPAVDPATVGMDRPRQAADRMAAGPDVPVPAQHRSPFAGAVAAVRPGNEALRCAGILECADGGSGCGRSADGRGQREQGSGNVAGDRSCVEISM